MKKGGSMNKVVEVVKKGFVVGSGKTKTIYSVEGMPEHVILEIKDDITKNDDPSQTKMMNGKAEYSTTTTCAVFSLLKKAGVPVAFEGRVSATEFLAPKCEMIPLEVVVRRYAVGSYLKRFPEFMKNEGEEPHYFVQPVVEFFLKTTGGRIVGRPISISEEMPIDKSTGRQVDDPLIQDYRDLVWHLRHPKVPSSDKISDLECAVFAGHILPDGVTVERIEELACKTFLLLEAAWKKLGDYRLIDFKIEFGISPSGELLIADVISNDEWRLRTRDWKELSKQLFRDGAPMGDIADSFRLVAELAERLE